MRLDFAASSASDKPPTCAGLQFDLCAFHRCRRLLPGRQCGSATFLDAEARLIQYGRNADAQRRKAGLLVSVGHRLLEPLCLILIAAALVSTATGDATSAVIILLIFGASVPIFHYCGRPQISLQRRTHRLSCARAMI